MPKCARGDDCGWVLFCPKCGADVSYKQSFDQLPLLPPVDPVYEDTSILFVGLRSFEIRGAYTAEAFLQESPDTSGKTLALRIIPGATWLDYHRAYKSEMSSWLRLIAFGRSRFRMVVVDTTKFLSVLALEAVDAGTIVLALAPNRDSTPMEQNTGYVALRTALRRGLPVILASNQYVKDLALVKEGEGLLAGQKAMELIIGQFVQAIRDIQDFVVMDSRIGIKLHCFSAVISASNRVYKTYDDLFKVQEFENSLEVFPDEVHTAYLIGSARKEAQPTMGQAFERYTKKIPNLTSARAALRDRSDGGNLYDVIMLFGVNESLIDGLMKDGYRSVAEKAGNLTAEEIMS